MSDSLSALQLFDQLDEEVRLALKNVGCLLDNNTMITALSRGLSNHNYLIATETGKWVLRLNSAASNGICDRNAELANWRLAQSADVAPKLLFNSTNNQCYLSEYIEHSTDWSVLMCANRAHPLIDCFEPWPEAEQYLLNLLNTLSSLPLPINQMSLPQQWHEYRQALTQHSRQQACHLNIVQRQLWQTRFKVLMAQSDKIEQLLVLLQACMLGPQYSHRDLNPHNLLFKNKLWCIDYEYACSSHPLVDLASVLATHRLSTSQRHTLISRYLEHNPNLTSDALKAVPAAIEIYWYFGCCWGLLMAISHHSDMDSNTSSENNDDDTLTRTDNFESFTHHSFDAYLNCFDDFIALID
ncbi:phosphotransferase [Shewanella colwelliana]|uniref:phosphotransferase n=1 Tax=Shewanella colwelliana TaxID=23 RepID=UPI000B005031|nr:phosphotransferase [Shewanella colwelliana]